MTVVAIYSIVPDSEASTATDSPNFFSERLKFFPKASIYISEYGEQEKFTKKKIKKFKKPLKFFRESVDIYGRNMVIREQARAPLGQLAAAGQWAYSLLYHQ